MELREKIIQTSRDLFFQRGLKSVSVDDLCTELGISKKTIYTQFGSKDEIVSHLVSDHLQHDFEAIQLIRATSKNAINELLAICEFNCVQHKAMNPIFVNDIKKFYPQEWIKIEHFLGSHINTCIAENIKRGQEEGYFRLDIRIDFVTNMYLKGLLSMIEFFSNQQALSFAELDREFMKYHICAIGTTKGINYLSKIKLD